MNRFPQPYAQPFVPTAQTGPQNLAPHLQYGPPEQVRQNFIWLAPLGNSVQQLLSQWDGHINDHIQYLTGSVMALKETISTLTKENERLQREKDNAIRIAKDLEEQNRILNEVCRALKLKVRYQRQQNLTEMYAGPSVVGLPIQPS